MVSIRRAKRGFQLRNRHRTTARNPETVGLVVAAVCLVAVVLWTGLSPAGGSSDTTTRRLPFRRRAHPELLVPTDELRPEEEETDGGTARGASSSSYSIGGGPAPQRRMGERFDAMALDILETLDCEKLLNETAAQLGKQRRNTDYDYPDDDDDNAVGASDPDTRRRLQEEVDNQHGDDGGFEGIEPGEPADAAAAAAEEDDDDKAEEEEDGGARWGRSFRGGGRRFDDDRFGGMDDFYYREDGGQDQNGVITARHLFCLAATPSPPSGLEHAVRCDATGSKRRALLDLWTDARAEIPDTALLRKVLEQAVESPPTEILGKTYESLWAPAGDQGLSFSVNTLNNEMAGAIRDLRGSLVPDDDDASPRVFVDVGSCLGLTTMAVAHEYPGTRVVSIEPAAPNWLLQETNLRCNLDRDALADIKVVLAGVGPNNRQEDYTMAKLSWKPTATTSTRSWNVASEESPGDVELLVRLRRLESILAEAGLYELPGRENTRLSLLSRIDVLHLDCQGCEYNLVPALSEQEFEAIPSVLGRIHWGYIPPSKLPSSLRGRTTHSRLCQHENIARTAKECCAFSDTPVVSQHPGEALYRDHGEEATAQQQPHAATVADVMEPGLCDHFEDWAIEHYLDAIEEDWGWFELTSQAED